MLATKGLSRYPGPPDIALAEKHVHAHYHFIRKVAQSCNVGFVCISTSEQAANGLTRPFEELGL
jgi:hypothetical protein